MPTFKISVHQEEWLTYYVEAEDEEIAEDLLAEGDCDDFKSTNCNYSILEIEEIKE